MKRSKGIKLTLRLLLMILLAIFIIAAMLVIAWKGVSEVVLRIKWW